MADELSPIEAIMWRVGQTGSLRMTVGAVLIVDRLPDRDALLERLRFAGDHAERLTQRPGGPASLRSRPSWVRAPFSPEHQLRSLSVSAPGTMREVLDLVGLLESVPFDPERSPWDVTLIDGLEDGKAAIFLRAHHVLTDGIGGIRLVGLLLDESAWPKDPLTPPAPRPPSPPPSHAPFPIRSSHGALDRSRSRQRSTVPRSSAGPSRGSTRRAASTRSSRRSTACSGRSTWRTRCPDSSW